MQITRQTSFRLGWFKKAYMFETDKHGLVIDTADHVVCVYGTNRDHTVICCAVPLCHPKMLRKQTIRIVDQQDRIGIDLGAFKVLIDYQAKTCACDRSEIRIYGSDVWGQDVSVPWTAEYAQDFV